MSKTAGERAGAAAAARHHRDPLCFDDTPNPYGIDSEPELWGAWQGAYEEEFELNR